MKNFKKIKGDASFRQFFRKQNNGYKSIIVVATREKFKNLIVYDAINKILNKNKILAPKLYSENYNKNYIEIEDFGNKTIFEILKKKKTNKLKFFKKIINQLQKIQLIKDKKIKNFKNNNYTIPKYHRKLLIKEASLFCDWYAKKNIPKNKMNTFSKKFKYIVSKLTLKIKLKNNIFVHRDFHVSNLMYFNNRIGIIDSQDALIGNKAYDLASLIDDVRFKTSEKFKNRIYNLYIKKEKKLNIHHFKNDFEILSILRNLKIIGIFTRLSVRDGKKNYLKLIPYAWKLVDMRMGKNFVFQDLKNLLKENFKKRIT